MELSGPEITRASAEMLRSAGWLVYIFNGRKAMPRGAKGFCDMVALRNGYVLFIEVKSENDYLTKEQIIFKEYFENNGARNVAYILAQSPDDVEPYVNWSR